VQQIPEIGGGLMGGRDLKEHSGLKK